MKDLVGSRLSQVGLQVAGHALDRVARQEGSEPERPPHQLDPVQAGAFHTAMRANPTVATISASSACRSSAILPCPFEP